MMDFPAPEGLPNPFRDLEVDVFENGYYYGVGKSDVIENNRAHNSELRA
jgi:hypothetical protein